MIALVRDPDPSISRCELTHLDRVAIDFDRLREQHAGYCEALERAGFRIRRLPPLSGSPDGVFVEDVALVLGTFAVVTRPGAASRMGEVSGVAEVLREFRADVHAIRAPASLDGGDVLCVGDRVFVGLSGRSNSESADQLRAMGLNAIGVQVRGCLHLKTAVTAVDSGTVLLNPDWVDPEQFAGFERVAVDPSEPFGANSLRLPSGEIVYPAEHVKTAALLRGRGYRLITTPISELAKAEAGVTCLSVLVC